LYVIFLVNHVIWTYTVGPGHTLMIFSLTVIASVIHLVLSLYGYFVGRKKAMQDGEDVDYKELQDGLTE